MADPMVFIDVVLWLVYLLMAAGVAVTLWSAIHSVRTHEAAADPIGARHSAMTGYLALSVVAATLAVTFAVGSDTPVKSNGHVFADGLWLRLTDMFIFSSIILICLCSVIVAVAKCRR